MNLHLLRLDEGAGPWELLSTSCSYDPVWEVRVYHLLINNTTGVVICLFIQAVLESGFHIFEYGG